jgi:AsmA protein
MQGRTVKELEQTVKGAVSLRGQGLVYHGGNLDEHVERFESSQTFNLFDVGAMLLAGPAGLLVTKGYEFVTVAQGTQGKSEIRVLVSDWTVDRGVARARDVAMATPANRVAIRGGIDFVNDRFQDMTVAVIDAKGCPKVQQQVRGTLRKPVVEKPNAIEALAAPAVQLLKKGAELVSGESSCEPFYAGSVAAPSPPK